MNRNNQFDRKSVEKDLFATYKNGTALQGRRTRTFLRKIARDIEHSYEIGRRDGIAGKPLVPLDPLQSPDDPPMKQDIFRRVHAAYRAGHMAGTQGVE